MYTLFAAPLTCSLAVHAQLLAYDVPFEITWVRRGPGRLVPDPMPTERRKVPTLVLPDGEVVSEIAVVLDLLDARHGPERTERDRREQRQWLSFLATELHKQVLAPAFDRETPDAAIDDARRRLLPHVLAQCTGDTLRGGAFGPEDAYLGWALVLLAHRWPEDVPAPLRATLDRTRRRPAFAKALAVELSAREAAR